MNLIQCWSPVAREGFCKQIKKIPEGVDSENKFYLLYIFASGWPRCFGNEWLAYGKQYWKN